MSGTIFLTHPQKSASARYQASNRDIRITASTNPTIRRTFEGLGGRFVENNPTRRRPVLLMAGTHSILAQPRAYQDIGIDKMRILQ